MKALLIVPLYPPDYDGGMELSAQSIAEGMRGIGMDMHVATSRYRAGFTGDRHDPNWVHRIYRFPLPFQRKKSRTGNRIETFSALLRIEREIDQNRAATGALLAEHKFDVAYVFDTQQIGNGTVEPLIEQGVPIVWNVSAHHMLEALRPKRTHRIAQLFLPRTRRSIRRPDYANLAFISGFMRDEYKAANIVAERDWITYRGLAERQIHPRELPHDSTFRVVGRHTWSKGLHVALDAAAILARSHPSAVWRLEFIGGPGDGDALYMDSLRQTIDKEGLSDRISFAGKLVHEEVLKRISTSVACIVPSVWDEPFGRTVIEAMAANVPVIAARSGAIPEMVEDGESALLYDREDSQGLARHMKILLEEPELRIKMQMAGAALVRERNSLTSALEKTHAMLCTVANSKRVNSPLADPSTTNSVRAENTP